MRYELADYEWIAIKPMLPNKPRGVSRVNDRRVVVWRATTGLQETTLPSSNWLGVQTEAIGTWSEPCGADRVV
jgi:transposase